MTSKGNLAREAGSGKSIDVKLANEVVKVFRGLLQYCALSVVEAMSDRRALSRAKRIAWGEISTACALRLAGGHRWQRRRGIQPEPVPRSKRDIGFCAVGDNSSESFMTQCSVSGRGIKTGGRVRRLSGPKG